MNKIAQNKKVFAMADKIATAIEQETEEILEHTEAVIKKYLPARYVKAALNKIETMLNQEGIEAAFDKAITREALRKTAKIEVTAKEIHETIDAVVAAAVAEMEDVLKDADEVADEMVWELVCKFDHADRFEVESKLKSVIEKKMNSKGIYCKFARNAKQMKK